MPKGVHSNYQRGEKRYNWKGSKASYDAFHKWLYTNFGKANKCENLNCKCLNPKRYEWALIKSKEYDHKRENFWMLCKSCHIRYDFTDKWRKNISLSKTGIKHIGYKRRRPIRYCSVNYCERIYFAKNYCSMHYQRAIPNY